MILWMDHILLLQSSIDDTWAASTSWPLRVMLMSNGGQVPAHIPATPRSALHPALALEIVPVSRLCDDTDAQTSSPQVSVKARLTSRLPSVLI